MRLYRSLGGLLFLGQTIQLLFRLGCCVDEVVAFLTLALDRLEKICLLQLHRFNVSFSFVPLVDLVSNQTLVMVKGVNLRVDFILVLGGDFFEFCNPLVCLLSCEILGCGMFSL